MRALLLISTLLLQVASTPSPATAPAPALTISVDVDLVNVLFTVSDRKGRLVSSLPRESFRVFDDNRAQEIAHFSSETDIPLNIALLLDTSGSVRDKIGFEREAAIRFLKATLRHGEDRATLIAFDSRIDLLHDYTDDTSALARAAGNIVVGGGTLLYDTVYWTSAERLARQNGRKIAIVISDGNDTTSRRSLDDALRSAQQSDTTIYCISTNSILRDSTQGGDHGNKILRRMAEETGGRLFLPGKIDDLNATFKRINEDLRAQYTLAYRPIDVRRDGAFHRIRIETNDKQLKIQARNGYFAARTN